MLTSTAMLKVVHESCFLLTLSQYFGPLVVSGMCTVELSFETQYEIHAIVFDRT